MLRTCKEKKKHFKLVKYLPATYFLYFFMFTCLCCYTCSTTLSLVINRYTHSCLADRAWVGHSFRPHRVFSLHSCLYLLTINGTPLFYVTPCVLYLECASTPPVSVALQDKPAHPPHTLHRPNSVPRLNVHTEKGITYCVCTVPLPNMATN